MKNVITTSLILILNITLLFSQSGKVTYIATINDKPISQDDSNYIEKKNMVDLITANSKDVEFELVFNNVESIYKKKEVLKNDSNKGFNFTVLLAGGDDTFYTNKQELQCIKSVEGEGAQFLVNTNPIKWTITRETKKIDNYICYKAITKIKIIGDYKTREKKVIAWFTKEIPIFFGPKLYYGLPGLIIELYENKLLLKASKIELNIKKNITIKRPSKGTKVTEKEYDEILKKLYLDDDY